MGYENSIWITVREEEERLVNLVSDGLKSKRLVEHRWSAEEEKLQDKDEEVEDKKIGGK